MRLPTLMSHMAVLASAVCLYRGNEWGSSNADHTDHGRMARTYLLALYGPASDCLELRAFDAASLWVLLRHRPGCPGPERFPELRLGFFAPRIYIEVVVPGIYTPDWPDAPIRIGPAPHGSPGARMRRHGRDTIVLVDPRFGLGALPPRYMADGKPGRISQAALFAHELNHDCGKTRGVSRTDSEACAVRAENRVRAAQGLVLRKTHNIDPAGN